MQCHCSGPMREFASFWYPALHGHEVCARHHSNYSQHRSYLTGRGKLPGAFAQGGALNITLGPSVFIEYLNAR